ncbi:MAG: hypothetical protein JNK61_12885 [Bacteroidia bacterium]|nr:hypothetical protein [Bacteroidia bacterium]HQU99682.1 hypothetical protein [Bacteroidia bacterium]
MAQQSLFTSSFKLFLKTYLIPVACIVIAAGGILNYFFEQKIILGSSSNGAYKVNRIIHRPANEISILGSSRAEGAFIPSILSSHAFNYGLSGAQDNVMLYFLSEALKQQSTQPIIINFDPEGLNSSLGDLSNYIYNASYQPVRKLMGNAYEPWFAIPFFKYFGSFELYTKYYLNSKLQLTKVTDCGGNFEKNVLTPQKFASLIAERKNTTTTFKNDTALERDLINLLITNKVTPLVFVLSPIHNSYFVSYKNQSGFKTFIDSITQIPLVHFINMHHSYPDSMFINTTHLNYNGAVVFSEQLKDSLQARGLLK